MCGQLLAVCQSVVPHHFYQVVREAWQTTFQTTYSRDPYNDAASIPLPAYAMSIPGPLHLWTQVQSEACFSLFCPLSGIWEPCAHISFAGTPSYGPLAVAWPFIVNH